MKNIKITFGVLILILIITACSEVEKIGSLRILGSNTEVENFSETEDGQKIILSKNSINLLADEFITNLNMQTLKMDSADIEKVAGNADTLVYLSSKGLGAIFPGNNIKTKYYASTAISICDQIALIDSVILVAGGGSECLPNLEPGIKFFTIDKNKDIKLRKSAGFEKVIDIKSMQRFLISLSADGKLTVNRLNPDHTLTQTSESNIPDAKHIRIIPKMNKFLVRTPTSVWQFELSDQGILKKINQIG